MSVGDSIDGRCRTRHGSGQQKILVSHDVYGHVIHDRFDGGEHEGYDGNAWIYGNRSTAEECPPTIHWKPSFRSTTPILQLNAFMRHRRPTHSPNLVIYLCSYEVFERTLKGRQQLVCLSNPYLLFRILFCVLYDWSSCFHCHKNWLDYGVYHVVKT